MIYGINHTQEKVCMSCYTGLRFDLLRGVFKCPRCEKCYKYEAGKLEPIPDGAV